MKAPFIKKTVAQWYKNKSSTCSAIALASLLFISSSARSFEVVDSTLDIKYYPYYTGFTDITGNVTWDTKKVTVSSYSKSEIKQFFGEYYFNYDYATADECDQDDDCDLSDSSSDILNYIDKVFKNYEKPDTGTITITGSLTISPGTVVELSDGMTLVVDGGTLTLAGDDEEQAILKGSSWGGIYLKRGGVANFSNCKITDAKSDYGAIRVDPGFNNLTIDNCEISNNDGFFGGAIHIEGANPTIKNSVIKSNNEAARGGGIYMINASPTLTNNQISDNKDVTVGGGIFMDNSSPTLRNNIIANNGAKGGGGLFISNNSNPTLYNNIIANNTGTGGGGGLLFDTTSRATIYNSTISANLAPSGSAIYIDGNSTPSFFNTIIYGNGDEEEGENGIVSQQIFQASLASFRYSLVEGGITGEGNIDTDPLFKSPSEKYGTGGTGTTADWSLTAGSPAINAGNSAASDNDYAGNARVFSGKRVDIGAYEFQNNPPLVSGQTADMTIAAETTDEDTDVAVKICAKSTDPENHTLVTFISSFPELGGTLYQYDEGDRGDEITDFDFTVDDVDGWVIYAPVNKSQNYTDSFTCQVKDQPLDSEGEVDDNVVATSLNKQTVTVPVLADNDPPNLKTVLTVGSNAHVNGNYDFTIEVTDPDEEDVGSVLSVSADQLVPWLTLTKNGDGTFTFTGVPALSDQEVDNTINMRIEDDQGNAIEESFTIDIGDQLALTVSIDGSTSGEPSKTLKLEASGSTGDTVTFHWVITDINGTIVKEGDGNSLNFLTTVEGQYSATVTVSDQVGSLSATDTVDISIGTGFTDVDDDDRDEPTDEDSAEIDSYSDNGTSTVSTTNISAGNVRTLATSSDSENINRLSQLALTSEQTNILLSAIASIIATATDATTTAAQTSQLLGALDNLVLENNLDIPLTSTQQTLFFSTIDSAASRLTLNQLQIMKSVEVLNEVVLQAAAIFDASQVSTLKTAISALTSRTFTTATSYNATSNAFVKMAAEVIDLTQASTSIDLGDPAEFQAKITLSAETLAELREKFAVDQIIVSLAANSVTWDHGVIMTVSISDISGNMLAVKNLVNPITMTIPVAIEGALVPQYFDTNSTTWKQAGISGVDSSAEVSVTFTTNHLTEFALFVSGTGDTGKEPGVMSKATDTLADTKNCFLDSLF